MGGVECGVAHGWAWGGLALREATPCALTRKKRDLYAHPRQLTHLTSGSRPTAQVNMHTSEALLDAHGRTQGLFNTPPVGPRLVDERE